MNEGNILLKFEVPFSYLVPIIDAYNTKQIGIIISVRKYEIRDLIFPHSFIKKVIMIIKCITEQKKVKPITLSTPPFV
jgi:hypothetical protein